MRTVLFQASRTIKAATESEPAMKEKVTKEVTIPTTFEELVSMFKDRLSEKITIGYTSKGERIRENVPFEIAMFLEGYKLYIGKQIAPEAEEEIDEKLEAKLSSMGEKEQKTARLMLEMASGKKKAKVREMILSGAMD